MSSVDKPNNVNNINSELYIAPNDNTFVANEKIEVFKNIISKADVPSIERKTGIKFIMPEKSPQSAFDFTDVLVANKARLMEVLGIDSATYDMLAQTAVGIACTETKFGTDFADKVHKFLRTPYKWYDQFFAGKQRFDYSVGMTNLKFTLHFNDKGSPEIKENMMKFGIYFEDQLEDTEKSAIATVILLSTLNRRLDRRFLEGFEQSHETFGANRMEALCALWNGGRARFLKDGKFNPKEWEYSQSFNKAIEEYKLHSFDN